MITEFDQRRSGLPPTAAQLFERLPRTLRRHRLMKAWMTATGESPLQLVRIRDQSFGYADMNDGFLRLIVIDGGFERDFFTMADAFLSNGGVFLDVGANFGLLTCGLAGKHGTKVQFHLFEPNHTLVDWIKRSLARYPGIHCRINCTAVSDRNGAVSFSINRVQSGASHITEESDNNVPSVTVDEYLDRQQIPTVVLMKMDIEGYELTAIRGAARSLRNRRIQAVYFEYFEKLLTRVAPPRDLLQIRSTLRSVFADGPISPHMAANRTPFVLGCPAMVSHYGRSKAIKCHR